MQLYANQSFRATILCFSRKLTLPHQGSYCSTTGRLLVHVPNTDFAYIEGTDNLSVCLYRYTSKGKRNIASLLDFTRVFITLTDSSFSHLFKTYRWGSKSITASFCKTCGIQVAAESRAIEFMFGMVGINVSVCLVLMPRV